jgi:hypothetical protein
MPRPKGSANKKLKFSVETYFKNGKAANHLFTTKRDALKFHAQVEREYDQNIRRSRGVVALKRGVVFHSYRRIGPKDPGWALVKACKDEGKWVCDAWTHNSRSGCANPECFKYKGAKS